MYSFSTASTQGMKRRILTYLIPSSSSDGEASVNVGSGGGAPRAAPPSFCDTWVRKEGGEEEDGGGGERGEEEEGKEEEEEKEKGKEKARLFPLIILSLLLFPPLPSCCFLSSLPG